METTRKYRVVASNNPLDFEDGVDALVEVGYKMRGRPTMEADFYRVVMELSDSPDLADAVNMVRIELDTNKEDGTPLLEKMLREGWIVTSEYSKAVQLMKVNSLQGKTKLEMR